MVYKNVKKKIIQMNAIDLGADSLDAVELIMDIEKEFNVQISDQEAQRIRIVGDIITSLSHKL